MTQDVTLDVRLHPAQLAVFQSPAPEAMKAARRERKRAQLQAWRAKNPNKVREHNRRQAERHGEKIGAYKKQWAAENLDPEQERERKKQWYLAHTEEAKAAARQWCKAHPDRVNALTAKRRAGAKRRTPPWLTPADFAAMRAIYRQARRLTRETGAYHHVDHVVPLQGESVSGLHVPWNLQVLSAPDNLRKGNKWTT